MHCIGYVRWYWLGNMAGITIIFLAYQVPGLSLFVYYLPGLADDLDVRFHLRPSSSSPSPSIACAR